MVMLVYYSWLIQWPNMEIWASCNPSVPHSKMGSNSKVFKQEAWSNICLSRISYPMWVNGFQVLLQLSTNHIIFNSLSAFMFKGRDLWEKIRIILKAALWLEEISISRWFFFFKYICTAGSRNTRSKVSLFTDFNSPLHGCLDIHSLYIIVILFRRIATFKYFSFSMSKWKIVQTRIVNFHTIPKKFKEPWRFFIVRSYMYMLTQIILLTNRIFSLGLGLSSFALL